ETGKIRSRNDCAGVPKRMELEDLPRLEHLEEDWGTCGCSGLQSGCLGLREISGFDLHRAK
ncbi:hypothetical protein KI387_038399, partial [Taxus chinensis]